MTWVLLPVFGLLSLLSFDDDPLAKYRWKNRVVLIFAPDAASPQRAEQRRLLQARQADADERDLVVLDLLPDSPDAATLRQRFNVKPGEFRVLLIGKDGGEKLRREKPVPPKEFFDLIDSMPMRQGEMRGKQ